MAKCTGSKAAILVLLTASCVGVSNMVLNDESRLYVVSFVAFGDGGGGQVVFCWKLR